jgi:hypothetical protein
LRWGLSSFLLGILVPGLGVAFAAFAIRRGRQAKSAFGGEWNPAAPHLRWGFRLASCGALLSVVLAAAVFLYVVGAS